MHGLIGKKVLGTYMNVEKNRIGFDIDGGEPVVYRAEGDCCSHSWIEHVSNPLSDATVVGIREVDLCQVSDHPAHDCLKMYGVHVLSIAKLGQYQNNMFVEFRNASNGFYGGSLELVPGADLEGLDQITEDI